MADNIAYDVLGKIDEFHDVWADRQKEIEKAKLSNAKVEFKIGELQELCKEAKAKIHKALNLDKDLDVVYKKVKEKREKG